MPLERICSRVQDHGIERRQEYQSWHLICKVTNNEPSLNERNEWTYTNDYEWRDCSVKRLRNSVIVYRLQTVRVFFQYNFVGFGSHAKMYTLGQSFVVSGCDTSIVQRQIPSQSRPWCRPNELFRPKIYLESRQFAGVGRERKLDDNERKWTVSEKE